MGEKIDLEEHLGRWNMHKKGIFARLDDIVRGDEAAREYVSEFVFGLFQAGAYQGINNRRLTPMVFNFNLPDAKFAAKCADIAVWIYCFGYESGFILTSMDEDTAIVSSYAILGHLTAYFLGVEAAKDFYSRMAREIRQA